MRLETVEMTKRDGMVDLHVHLDGSLSVNIIRALADIQGIELIETDEELREKLQVADGCKDLNEYLEKFDFPLTFLQTSLGIEECVYLLMKELKTEGLAYSEVRFAPQLHKKHGLSQETVVKSAIRGLKRSGFPSALILCCMRGENCHKENMETVRIAAKYLGQGVCAVDLAGAEALFPTRDYEELFAYARKMNVPFTIHAGEASGPESVRAAIAFGAKRIGHGVRACEDSSLMELIAEKEIVLELCPTSNLHTAVFSDIQKYPIRTFLDKGIKVTINTDNRMVSNTTLQKEYELLIRTHKLTETEVELLIENSKRGAFSFDGAYVLTENDK